MLRRKHSIHARLKYISQVPIKNLCHFIFRLAALIGNSVRKLIDFLEDDYFDTQSANICVKPKVCMRQMTHETIFICVIQQYNGVENTALAEHCLDEMLRYAAFHLGLHYLSKYTFSIKRVETGDCLK